jgi:DNA replication protein DnaC
MNRKETVMNNPQATLEKLERMSLQGMARALQTALEAGGGSDISPEELLSTLVDAEWEDRRARKLTRLLKAARLRYRAGVEDVDFGISRNLAKAEFLRLADCRWIQEHASLIISGPCGCGKSFLASALAQQACIYGYRALYWSASKLFAHLKLCKADGTYLRELGKIGRRELLVIDDFGLEGLDGPSRIALLEILEDRHGRASTLIATQLPVAKWHDVIGEPTIADAICDRIVHTAYRIELKGESVRKLYAQRAKPQEVLQP